MFTNHNKDLSVPWWYTPFMIVFISILVLLASSCTKVTIFYPEACIKTSVNISTGEVTEVLLYPEDPGFRECVRNSDFGKRK